MRIAAYFIVALCLTACSSAYQLSHFDYGRYSRSAAYAAAKDGKMVLAVYGNPTNGGAEGLAEAVADSMHGTHVDYRTVFVPAPSAPASGYRTVVVFGGGTPETVCEVDETTELTAGSPTRFSAGFCLDTEVLSYVSGSIPTIANVNDRGLSHLMRITGLTLFPHANPNYGSDCGADTVICRD